MPCILEETFSVPCISTPVACEIHALLQLPRYHEHVKQCGTPYPAEEPYAAPSIRNDGNVSRIDLEC